MSAGASLGEYFSYNRRASDRLSHRAQKWLNELPAGIRPLKLTEVRPRIVNEISLLWEDEDSCLKYLHELVSKHTDPKFLEYFVPAPFLQEIVALYDFRSRK